MIAYSFIVVFAVYSKAVSLIWLLKTLFTLVKKNY